MLSTIGVTSGAVCPRPDRDGGVELTRELNGLLTIVGKFNGEPALLEEILLEFLHVRVALDDEDESAHAP
jgi:hypothetical protein